MEPGKFAVITLIYEGLLERRLGLYENAIHIDPDTVRHANNYRVAVSVADSRNITLLRGIAGDKTIDKGKQAIVPCAEFSKKNQNYSETLLNFDD